MHCNCQTPSYLDTVATFVGQDGVYTQSRRGCVYTPSLGTAYTRHPAGRECNPTGRKCNPLLILKRMLLFPSEVRVAWVFLGISLGLRPREIPRKTQATPPSEGKSVSLFSRAQSIGPGSTVSGDSASMCVSTFLLCCCLSDSIIKL